MATVSRVEKWQGLFISHITSASAKKFKWGKHDCAMFAADCVKAMTGTDLAKEFRGYRSKTKANQSLGGLTLETAMEKVAREFSIQEVKLELAMRGDVVLVDVELGPALGICTGTHAVFAAPIGLTHVQISLCRRAWRIPF